MSQMDQKTIFITGAGSGIGAATARTFVQAGWIVGVYDINQASVEALARELGASVYFGAIDVADRTSVDAALTDFTGKTDGRLDVMCNNAGVFDDCEFDKADAQVLRRIIRIIRINAEGVVNCSQAAFPWLRDTRGARLVNLGSAASIYGVPNEATYSASKFFVRGLSEALQLEWAQHDIAVSLIMPSYVATPMADNADISWIRHSDIKLTAEDIAQTVLEAVDSKKFYWIMPRDAKVQSLLVRFLPSALLTRFSKAIFYGRFPQSSTVNGDKQS